MNNGLIICPWCGTNYLVFQSNCKNCGGRLPAAGAAVASTDSPDTLPPPPAPRPISERYVWRLLSSNANAIGGGILAFLGLIFGLVGAPLAIAGVTAFVGIPFFLLGVILLAIGGWMFIGQYKDAQKLVHALRTGEATHGRIVEVQENHAVQVNGRNPWSIRYQFEVNGHSYEGTVSTLNAVGDQLREGETAWVLYLPTAPQWSSIYPHP
jgi:membrane protein implicated in regulation of membrane protease activity